MTFAGSSGGVVRARTIALTAVLAVAASVAGCTVGPGVSGLVDLAEPGRDSVRFVYLGSGGWIMERGRDQVLTGPLFTNPGMVRTGLASIRSDPDAVDRYLAPYDVSLALAILVGHAHYDHLMDVPQTAARHAPAARIVGSTTVRNTLGTWSGLADRIDTVEAYVSDEEHVGRPMRYGNRVHVWPLRSHHAPHFDGYTLYQGSHDRPLAEEPRLATDWVEGKSYAFLIDFLNADGAVDFRIYYQDAVAAAPAGLAPRALIAEHPVDVAILVPATFDQVDWHPEALIENLRPRRVLLGHWENFFVSPDVPTKSILLTDTRHFEDRLERVFDGDWWRPELWTEFRFPVG